MASTFLEEIWSRNLGHVFVSPLRPWELLAALVGMSVVRMLLGVLPASVLAWLLYAFNMFALGPVLVLFVANLMVMGWWVALGVRLADPASWRGGGGAGVVGAVWPDAVLGGVTTRWRCCRARCSRWRWRCRRRMCSRGCGRRSAQGVIGWDHLAWALGLNVVWMAAAMLLFSAQFRVARQRGALTEHRRVG